jgi:hypothetical protein
MQLVSRRISLEICEIDNHEKRIELFVSILDGREIFGEAVWVKRDELDEFCTRFESLYVAGDRSRASLSSDPPGKFQLDLSTPPGAVARYSNVSAALIGKPHPNLAAPLVVAAARTVKMDWEMHHNAFVGEMEELVSRLGRLDAVAARIEHELAKVERGPTNAAFSRTGLAIPPHVLALDAAGRWKFPKDRSLLNKAVNDTTGDAQLISVASMKYMHLAHFWAQGTDSTFLGEADTRYPPGDIDRKQAIFIGDLGIGYDQPIALDYRDTDPLKPRVLLLTYPKDVPRDRTGWPVGRWVMLADTVEEFTRMVGMT